ncbi:TraB/GumN family protein [Aquimonas voraii]|uniref:TraB family protein n=1 Tax=Aquimonas voraii TaxID=265719 RepID=A0A1G6ZCJ1_9GAMM|nr:TraB/GumN family protein [Aquimonas voraii]SDD99807.1 TraB family protein [Aquimonas voraii]
MPSPFALARVLLLGAFALALRPVAAQTEPTEASAAEATTMATVEVIARVSGPGLWEVRNGENVLWILGTQSPLPRRFEWVSDEVDARLAESSLLIAPPSVAFGAGIGRFRALTLLPSLLRARRNPDERSLEAVVGPDLYARWQPLKRRYLGRNRKVETWRPLFAAIKLWEEAIEDARMTGSGPVWRAVSKSAKKLKLAVETPQVAVSIADPRDSIRSFAQSPLDDLECFSRTLERLESDIEAMRERAEAWAVGDLESLRALPFSDQNRSCQDAFLSASIGEQNRIADVPERLREAWLASVDKALAEHRSSVAVISIASLLDPESGLMRALRERGYAVRAPDGGEDRGPEAAAQAPTELGALR